MYSRKEFEDAAVSRGYASRGNVRLYIKANPKESYTEEDLIDCYRYDARELKEKNLFNGGVSKHSMTEEEAMQAKRDSWLY